MSTHAKLITHKTLLSYLSSTNEEGKLSNQWFDFYGLISNQHRLAVLIEPVVCFYNSDPQWFDRKIDAIWLLDCFTLPNGFYLKIKLAILKGEFKYTNSPPILKGEFWSIRLWSISDLFPWRTNQLTMPIYATWYFASIFPISSTYNLILLVELKG